MNVFIRFHQMHERRILQIYFIMEAIRRSGLIKRAILNGSFSKSSDAGLVIGCHYDRLVMS